MNTIAYKELSKITIINEMTATRASVIADRTNSIQCGMTKAMMIEVLKNKLKTGVAHFIFAKKDGSLREAWGTIKSELATAHINGRGVSRENYACCAYWDVEKGAWRSFRWETLIQVF